ncbi:MAG TPA: alpha-mannosidase [bacterium]|nr:alpha-mannosidase [bacterium]
MLNHPKLTEQRIRRFLKEHSRDFYAAKVPLAASFTHDADPIPFAELGQRQWRPIAVGSRWGGNWESAWFRFSGEIPAEWGQKPQIDTQSPIAIRQSPFAEVWGLIDTGSEACVFDAQGQPVCGLTSGDGLERKALVPTRANSEEGGERREEGRQVEFLVEAAANHLFGHMPDCLLKEACLVLLRRDVWDFYHDFYFLNGLATALPEDHPRRARIRYSLNEAVNRYGAGSRSEVAAARAALAVPLAKRANASAQQVSAIGHAHIDVAWLWPLRETVRKTGRTFSSALRYMEEYPEYKFGASQAQLYAFTKEHYPGLYERVKAAVKSGRWEVQGGMWVEADCNIPSGESLVRQLLHGKRFFQSEFGVDVENLWLPDVFGYSATLPQILKLAGVKYFTTQKLSWNQFNRFPHNTFRWEGIDGTSVFTHFPPSDTYCGDFEPKELIKSVQNFTEKDRADRWLYLFGFGDGGGGPSRHQLELAARTRDCEELPRVTQEFASDFFPKAEAGIADLPVWRGELYFELHRGTLTSQARNKRSNRRAELLLREAEYLLAVTGLAHDSNFPHPRPLPEGEGRGEGGMDLGHVPSPVMSRAQYPREELDRIWKLVLTNQFHDIIPGSSIGWVYRDSARDYAEIVSFAEKAIARGEAELALQATTRGNGRPVVVANSLSWQRSDVVTIPLEAGESEVAVKDSDGNAMPVQVEDGKVLVKATAPSMGHCVLFVTPVAGRVQAPVSSAETGASPLEVTENLLENEQLRAEFDQHGHLVRIYDKVEEREVIPAGERANVLALYEDVPAAWEAWDVDVFYEEKPPVEAELLSARVGEKGPVRASLVQEWRISEKSKLVQEVRLARDSRRLEFMTRVDWHEERKMLRTSFPVTVHAAQATFEIQYGHVQRPTHRNTSWDEARFEVVAHKWADLSGPDYGVALLNDCKYGHKVLGNVLDLNLLRSPKSPDPEADLGEHEFTYALFPHRGDFRRGWVIGEAYSLNVPLRSIASGQHDGPLPAKMSRFETSLPNVIIEVVKRAEDDDSLVLRLYEAFGQPARTALTLRMPFSRAFVTDLLEHNVEELTVTGGRLELAFRPFEIKTIRLMPADSTRRMDQSIQH